MSTFSGAELAYLRGERRLARLATVGPDGTPTSPRSDVERRPDSGVVEVTGHDFAATRNSATSPAPTAPRSSSTTSCRPSSPVASRSAATPTPSPTPSRPSRIYPERIVGWGLDDAGVGRRHARDVGPAA